MARSYAQRVGLCLPWTSLLSVFLLLSAAVVVFAALRVQPSDTACDRHTYPWSPAIKEVKYRWETFENHQFAISTPYFGFEPTDQIEDAWDELLPKHPIAIPGSRLQDLSRSEPADDPAWVRNPDDPDSVLALPEYAVQLGCLNFLRQMGYRSDRNFTHLKAFGGSEDLVWERAYQCLERLRQAIMCWGDVGAITLYYDDRPRPGATPGAERDVSFDFGTLHYCRNFDALNEWTKRNGVQSVVMDNLWWGGSSDVVL